MGSRKKKNSIDKQILYLENEISKLKNGRSLQKLKEDSIKTYYKVQQLSEDLSMKRAEKNGNFITKNDLTEYKGLIIYMMKKGDYNRNLNIKEASTELLNRINKKNVLFKTRKGIKGIITRLALEYAIDNSYENFIKNNNIDLSRENTLNSKRMKEYQQWKLKVMQNNGW